MSQAGAQGVSAALQQRMNFLIARQGVVSSNIANAATPGYLSKDLSFSAKVNEAAALQKTHAKHMGNGQVSGNGTMTENFDNMKLNGNSVDTTTEMLKLNEIQNEFNLMTRLRSKHVQMYRAALGRQQ